MKYEIKTKFFLILIFVVILSACGGGGEGIEGTGQSEADKYMKTLPTWGEFAPKALPENEEGSEKVTSPPVIEDILSSEGVLKVCTTETVDFFDTPEEYVMYAPPTRVLYPGALVQGRSLRDGDSPSDILSLNISQRTPVSVSIPECTFENNFRTVLPTASNVHSAIGSILQEAVRINESCTNLRGNLSIESFRNDEQRALKGQMSGKYFGFSAKASGTYDKSETQNSVAAIFRENLFTVQIEAPQTPGGWFSDEFTSEKLQEQIALGKIAADNIPAYVAQVSYGRILTATMTSNSSETAMRLAMAAKIEKPGVSVEGSVSVETQKVLDASTFTVAYLGGSTEATATMLQSNDWTAFFGKSVTASDAVPISFEIRSSTDNTLAVTQELTSYDRVTCFDKLADKATFLFQEEQKFTSKFTGAGQQVATGDIDGDGNDDIVWVNSSTNGRGEFSVAFSNGDGSFQSLINEEHVGLNDLLGDVHLLVADVDKDGRDDIVFNVLKNAPSEGNQVFVSFYKDAMGPGFLHSKGQDMGYGRGAPTFKTYIAQMDYKNGMDLVWNNTPNSTDTNRTYIAHAVDTSEPGFDLAQDDLFNMSSWMDHPGKNFSGYEYTHIADFDGDGFSDIVWQNIDVNGNGLYIAKGTSTGLDFSTPHQSFGSRWQPYISLAGDANGDGRADLVEPRQKNMFADFGIYFGQGNIYGSKIIAPHTFKSVKGNEDDFISIKDLLQKDVGGAVVAIEPDMLLADVNGDGSKDLIINDKGLGDSLTNNIGVGLSVVNGAEFSFSRSTQTHDSKKDWLQYQTLVADVNGDKREDVIWISNGPTSSVFVGLARGN